MKKLSFDVVTVGSATEDVFCKTEAETIKITHPHFSETLLAYPLGGKILVKELDFQIGGGGTNTATTFARQQLRTGWIGKLGKDRSGVAVMKFLKEEQITFLGSVGGQTGYSIILDSEEEDRTILAFKGANNTLTLNEIQQSLDALETRWLYCSSMLEESFKTMKAIIRHAKESGAQVAFNPSAYQAAQGAAALKDLLAMLDVLIMNKEEAQLLTGSKSEDEKRLLRALHATGAGICIITDGPRGVTLLAEEHFLHVDPLPGHTVVETTGAGDAFGSGFVAGLARGKSVKESLILGVLNAESVIAHYGAKKKILKRVEADILMAQDKRPIIEVKA